MKKTYNTPPKGVGECREVVIVIFLTHKDEERSKYEPKEANVQSGNKFLES